MNRLIKYLTQIFCNHDVIRKEEYYNDRYGCHVSEYCKKCGYHKSYWKY